jgi:hypothetical protein
MTMCRRTSPLDCDSHRSPAPSDAFNRRTVEDAELDKPFFVTVLAVNAYLYLRLLPSHAAASSSPEILPSRANFLMFVGGEYLGSLAQTLMLAGPILIVVVILRATQNAYFSIPWLVGNSLSLVLSGIATPLIVESTADPARIYAHVLYVMLNPRTSQAFRVAEDARRDARQCRSRLPINRETGLVVGTEPGSTIGLRPDLRLSSGMSQLRCTCDRPRNRVSTVPTP